VAAVEGSFRARLRVAPPRAQMLVSYDRMLEVALPNAAQMTDCCILSDHSL